MIKGFEDYEATRTRVIEFVKLHSPEHLRDRRIAKALNMPVKVVRACLHFHSSIMDPRVQRHYRSPYNMRRKRPVWFYGELPVQQMACVTKAQFERIDEGVEDVIVDDVFGEAQ